ncbi:unnamed protein product [Calypogeia fissa]
MGRIVVHVRKDEASGDLRREMVRKEEGFLRDLEIHEGERVEGFVDDVGCGVTMKGVLALMRRGVGEIEVGRDLYDVIDDFVHGQVKVNTKYKTVDKKVKPVAVPLPLDVQELLRKAREERAKPS